MMKRLKAIEARCKAMGWEFRAYHERKYDDGTAMDPLAIDYMLPDAIDIIDFFTLHRGIKSDRFHIEFRPLNKTTIEAAESLLEYYEPGPMVTIDPPTKHDPPRCNPAHCPMGRKCPYVIREKIPPGYSRGTPYGGYTLFHPGPDCPGEGTFKIGKAVKDA